MLNLSKNITPEITIEETLHSRLRTEYRVDYVIGEIQFSGSVTEDAGGNLSFEPNWFIDNESEVYWDSNWEAIEDEILKVIP